MWFFSFQMHYTCSSMHLKRVDFSDDAYKTLVHGSQESLWQCDSSVWLFSESPKPVRCWRLGLSDSVWSFMDQHMGCNQKQAKGKSAKQKTWDQCVLSVELSCSPSAACPGHWDLPQKLLTGNMVTDIGEKCTHEHNGVSWLFQFSSLSVWQRFAVCLSTVEVREVFGSGGLNAAWSVGTKIATWYTEVNILEYQQLWSEAIMLLWVHMCIATGIPLKHMEMDYIGLYACVEPLKTQLLST